MGLRGYNSLRKKVRGMRRDLREEPKDAAEAASEQVARDMKRNVVEGNQVWMTNLFRSIGVESEVDGYGRTKISIVADVPYAAYVEFGTGARGDDTAPLRFQFDAPAHTPELTREITRWVFTKPGFYGERSRSTARAIAKTISEEGTYPNPFMRLAWHGGRRMVLGSTERAVKMAVRRN